MARTTTVYRERGGQIEKRVVSKLSHGDYEAPNFHQNIINIYAHLEATGQLRPMKASTKVAVRDLHLAAQDARYWD